MQKLIIYNSYNSILQ